MIIPMIGQGVCKLKEKINHSLELPFQTVLPESVINASVEAENHTYRNRVYTPAVTVWALMSQMLSKDKSGKNAVSQIIATQAAKGKSLPSSDPSAYHQARARFPEQALKHLAYQTGQGLEEQVCQGNLWKGRHVEILDGSTLLMADTAQNQLAYPQHGNQKAGCGFPLARIVATFSMLTGALKKFKIADCKTHEVNLARQIYPTLVPNTVVLGDAIFGSFADFWLLRHCGIDALFKKHGTRKTDFRKGQRLGKGDHLIIWTKPVRCPKGLAQDIYDQLPQNLTLREVKCSLTRKGFLAQKIILVTTLLDPIEYPKLELAHLFGLRWDVELDLRHLKTTMKMEFLKAESPQMIRKEIYAHLLAYNLIRTLMWQAGMHHDVDPLRLSFQATIQHLLNFVPQLIQAGRHLCRALIHILLACIAKEKLADRPGRKEPRVLKRRHKRFPWMQEPRHSLRRMLVS